MASGVLRRVGILGAGNVGSSVAIQLAASSIAQHVDIASREPSEAMAAVLDSASAYPETVSEHFRVMEALSGAYDVVVFAAGIQPGSGVTTDELLTINTEIVLRSVSNLDLEEDPVLIIVGTPVDLVAERVQTKLPTTRVIGFGGELDTARLRYLLMQRGIDARNALVIGEHGPRAIPVYSSELNYDEVRRDVGSFLSTITGPASKARNLASGVQITRLLRALGGAAEIQSVSRIHPSYGISLTWPWLVNEDGAITPAAPQMGPAAEGCLRNLLESRGVI